MTTQGERLTGTTLWFETPTDLNESTPASNLFQFQAQPLTPRFEAIRSIILRDEKTEWLSSDAAAIETYYLGVPGKAAPPPPDWRRSFGQADLWRAAIPITPGTKTAYLNRAQFVWASPKNGERVATGEFLFRQRFTIEEIGEVIAARLRLTGNADFAEAALNDSPLPLAGRQGFVDAEFEVTPLLRAGENIVALRASSQPSSPMDQSSVAFHIQMRRVSPGRGSGEASPEKVLLLGSGGDRVWGGDLDLNPDRLKIETVYGSYSLPWEAVGAVIFPQGWQAGSRASGGFTERIKGWFRASDSGKARDFRGVGAPIQFLPAEQDFSEEILLTDGRVTKSHPSRTEGDNLILAGEANQSFSLKLADIGAIYPPRVHHEVMQKPRVKVGPIFCKIVTIAGNEIFGVLRQAHGRRAVIETQGGDFLKIPPGQISRITFPYHGLPAYSLDAAERAVPSGKVAIIAQAGGLEKQGAEYAQLSAQVQEAGFLAGIESVMLPQEELTQGSLSAKSYPVVISVDPLGEYPDTLAQDGDARKSLDRFVRAGGALVLFSRGGALRTAVVSNQGRFIRTVREGEGLAKDLELRTLQPSAKPPDPFHPFDRPPNEVGGIHFERTAASPHGLESLPASFELSAMPSAPFYPMADKQGAMQQLYILKNGGNLQFGPGLTLIARGTGVIIIIDHLMWFSTTDGQPFSRTVLPMIFTWAARQRNGQAVK